MYVFTYTDAPAEASGSGTESWTLDAVQVLVLGIVQQTYYCADFSKGSTEGKPRLSCNCKIVRERGPRLSAQLACPGARRRIRLPQISLFSVSFLPHLCLLIRFLLMRGTRVCRYRYGKCRPSPHTVFVLLHRIPIPTPLPPTSNPYSRKKFTQCLPPPLTDTLCPW
ncbi:hypothetical protein DFP73DRAFT_199114 [Morchella snyderi]|nr:hypothetical protein DFP73DRAFT_199114 [Morchella snyderi]